MFRTVKVKEFKPSNTIEASMEAEVNTFLKGVGEDCISVVPFLNSYGNICYVVTYS